jgi:hypothetical protein
MNDRSLDPKHRDHEFRNADRFFLGTKRGDDGLRSMWDPSWLRG